MNKEKSILVRHTINRTRRDNMSNQDLSTLLRNRASVREYSKRKVTDKLLYSLLESAARTQTMGNLQLYSIIITRDAEMKEKLAPAHYCQPMINNCQVMVTICADFNRTTRWCEEREATPGYNNYLSFLNAASDALLYTQTFSCLAEEAGLGVCYLGTTIYNASIICDVLELPQLVFPIATLTIGWPSNKPKLSDRLPLASFIHQEKYCQYSKEDIDTYYCERENLSENKEFVEINNKSTLAQVFTDIRYTKKDNETISKNLLETLKKQGFIQDNVELEEDITEMLTRPDVLDCDVVRFQNNKEKWVAFVGLRNGRPYEIFTGLMDDDEGIVIPKRVTKGRIIRAIESDGTKRYDFQFENKRGFKTTVEGLSGKFNKEYWNYAKLISGVLRYRMPLDNVVRLVASLSLENESINTWKVGVARALKKYVKDCSINLPTDEEEDSE